MKLPNEMGRNGEGAAPERAGCRRAREVTGISLVLGSVVIMMQCDQKGCVRQWVDSAPYFSETSSIATGRAREKHFFSMLNLLNPRRKDTTRKWHAIFQRSVWQAWLSIYCSSLYNLPERSPSSGGLVSEPQPGAQLIRICLFYCLTSNKQN